MDESGETQDALRSGDWKLLAERASKEMDPDKLMSLVMELNRLLEEAQRKPHALSEDSHENRSEEWHSSEDVSKGPKLTST
jgi:hypothetical protein